MKKENCKKIGREEQCPGHGRLRSAAEIYRNYLPSVSWILSFFTMDANA